MASIDFTIGGRYAFSVARSSRKPVGNEELELPDHPVAAAAISAVYARICELQDFVKDRGRHDIAAEWLERWEKRTLADIERHLGRGERDAFVRQTPRWDDLRYDADLRYLFNQNWVRHLVTLVDELRTQLEAIFSRVEREREEDRRQAELKRRAANPSRVEFARAHARVTGLVVLWLVVVVVFLVSLLSAPRVEAAWPRLEPFAWTLSLPVSFAAFFGLLPLRRSLERYLAQQFLRALLSDDKPPAESAAAPECGRRRGTKKKSSGPRK